MPVGYETLFKCLYSLYIYIVVVGKGLTIAYSESDYQPLKGTQMSATTSSPSKTKNHG